ncbi:TyrS-associated PheT N-terminal domain-related protein TapR [Mycoplasma sp. 6243]|uniref:TyrS-associated PheT N-terminal domain-related protein TapR n=1 Tax=Mycoplasma sp. 6243 TaxID=3440865 RepID=UPI003EBFD331
MIICNNLNKFFSNTSIIFVDAKVVINKQIRTQNAIFFIDSQNNVNSINLLDNKLLDIKENQSYFTLNTEQKSILMQIAKTEGLVIKDEQKFIYGEIIERNNHPNSDKLYILKININKDKLIQIVTNTADSQVGKIVVLALPGTVINDGSAVLLSKLLDVESFGMLSGYKSLGLNGDGLIFGTKNDIGKDFEF